MRLHTRRVLLQSFPERTGKCFRKIYNDDLLIIHNTYIIIHSSAAYFDAQRCMLMRSGSLFQLQKIAPKVVSSSLCLPVRSLLASLPGEASCEGGGVHTEAEHLGGH